MEQVNGTTSESPFDLLAKLRQQQVEEYNNSIGDMDEIDCKICLNRGHIAYLENGYQGNRECECMEKRRNVRRLRESGLEEIAKTKRLDNFIAKSEWQKFILEKAKKYMASPDRMFFIGGQVGAGKTHICTAICMDLIGKGFRTKYMIWTTEAARIKFDMQDYDRIMNELAGYPVLYIDDLFKTTGSGKVSDVEIRLMFDIINHRYNNRNLITIISSERTIQEIMELDQAIGSRIYEMSKESIINIPKDKTKNQRLGGQHGN